MTDKTTEIPDMCDEGWRIRFDWQDSRIEKRIYENHLRTCPQCRAHFAALDKLAEKAVMPEGVDEE